MMFWIAVAVLAAAVTYAIARPLLSPPVATRDAAQADLAVYRDQLREIDAEEARGGMAAAEAQSARAEISRRLLRHADEQPQPPVKPAAEAPGAQSNFAFLAMSLGVPLLSMLGYLAVGSPTLPGQPLAERISGPVSTANPNDLVARVEARLREAPDDGQGWGVIAPIYMRMGRFDEAAEAFANANRILGETPERLQGFATARIRGNNGMVVEDARKALRRALELDRNVLDAKAWLALGKEQDGDVDGAKADYRAIIAAAPESRWRTSIEEHLAQLDGKPTAGAAAAPNASAAPDLSAMPLEQRQAVISQMVSGLAERLKANPKDGKGWTMLIRSYVVMGRKDDALKAVTDARSALTGDASALTGLDALVQELGLGG